MPRTLRPALLPAALLAALAALGCSDDRDVLLEPPPKCTGEVTLEASAGTTPTFTWEPACAVDAISVFQPLTTPTEVWRLTGAAAIRPGARYGETPRGTVTTVGPDALQRGVEAAVELIIISGGEPQVIGGVSFTP